VTGFWDESVADNGTFSFLDFILGISAATMSEPMSGDFDNGGCSTLILSGQILKKSSQKYVSIC